MPTDTLVPPRFTDEKGAERVCLIPNLPLCEYQTNPDERCFMLSNSKMALVVLILGLSTVSLGQMVLYDDFKSKHIDPAKWVGERSSPQGSDAFRREVSVGLVGTKDRRLAVSETVYSTNTGNTGDSGTGFGLGFARPKKISAVSFTLTVNQELAVGCKANPDFGYALAGLFGDYFNPEGAKNGAMGDIVASVGISRFWRDPKTSLTVNGSFSRCDDSKCDGQTVLHSQGLGTVALGSTNTLSLAWDRPNHQFVFQLNANTPVQLAYTESDKFPPGVPDKSFFVFGDVAACTSTPRPTVSIDALFGNVFVNR
jgi:hypothetical protein